MFNRKQFIITLVVMGVVIIGAGVAIYILEQDWLYLLIVMMLAYLFLKYKLTAPLQHFSTKFNLLVDYDLDLEEALRMAKAYYENAPTNGLKAIYRWYLGMVLYYSGNYEEAIRTLNQVDLRRMNPIYQVLIFVFEAYSAYELEDREQFDLFISRIEAIRPRIPMKYQNFVNSYLEILNAMKNKEQLSDQFKEVVEKHFNRNDGYISTKLIYHYRMAEYFEVIHDELEMDKHLAFVIANGKNHHLAFLAKRKFKGLVNVDDFIYDPTKQEEEILPTEVEPIQQIDHSQLEEVEIVEEEKKEDQE